MTSTPHTTDFDVLIIGAGLTGLTTARELLRGGLRVALAEQTDRIGGVIQTEHCDGFTLEQGPNTGLISTEEVATLLGQFPDLILKASPKARRRLILKTHQGTQRFFPLPSSLGAAIKTPLFTFRDKLRLLAEPFRPVGTAEEESVASLVRRRLGKSYLDYAVNPFIGGIYAGDPEKLVTRYALPKLDALEQRYGSFIRGAIAKAREPKSDAAKQVTKEIFSTHGGLSTLIQALGRSIPTESLLLSTRVSQLTPAEDGAGWQVTCLQPTGQKLLRVRDVITTIPAPTLPPLLPFLDPSVLSPLLSLRYAPVIQVAWGVRDSLPEFFAFGGLVPSHEDPYLLGILNPSACFPDRAPEGHTLLSVFLGGMRSPELIDWTDEAIYALVQERLERLLGISQPPVLSRIFRHRYAIPQYEAGMRERWELVRRLEAQYPGLHLAGAIRDGIGIPDRIKQGCRLAAELLQHSSQAHG